MDYQRFIKWLLLLFALVLFQGCECSSRPDPNYAPFLVDGWGVKYFSTKIPLLNQKGGLIITGKLTTEMVNQILIVWLLITICPEKRSLKAT